MENPSFKTDSAPALRSHRRYNDATSSIAPDTVEVVADTGFPVLGIDNAIHLVAICVVLGIVEASEDFRWTRTFNFHPETLNID